MTLLVDGDIVAYRCSAVCNEPDQEGLACWQAREMLRRIQVSYPHHDMVVYLSGDTNFRKEIYPAYKANRKDMVRPIWLEQVKQHLSDEFGAITTEGYEADDALGINYKPGDIIASIDKDLLMIPGVHYNFVKDEEYDISEREGLYRFYLQVLTGDRTDNIPGLKGIGPKTGERILSGCTSEYELHERVRQSYSDDDFYLLNARLVWILREEGKMWTFPTSELDEGQSSESMTRMPEESAPSTEPTSTTESGTQSPGPDEEPFILIQP